MTMAASNYYIELGSEVSEEGAVTQWQELSSQYRDVLGDLQFNPSTVIQSDNKVVTRIQAGPVESKAKAQKLCARLFEDGTPCFVVEGERMPPRPQEPEQEAEENVTTQDSGGEELLASASEAPQEATAANEKPAVEDDSDEGFMPWLFGSSSEKQAEAPTTATEAKVDVAEAIRVPLTEKEEPTEEPKVEPVFAAEMPPQAAPEPKPEPKPQSLPPQPVQRVAPPKPVQAAAPEPVVQQEQAAEPAAAAEQGWLSVSAFEDEEGATALWQDARAASPSQAAGLRVRIVKPLMNRGGRPVVKLSVGPFPAETDALNFCATAIKPVNGALNCRFETSEPPASAQMRAPRYEHSNLYEARRRMLLNNRAARRAERYVPHAVAEKQYWAQVVTAATQVDALRQWERLRAAHPNLLDGLRSSVSASLAGRAKYSVRIGPIGNRAEAVSLCDSLKEQGVSCSIFSNM